MPSIPSIVLGIGETVVNKAKVSGMSKSVRGRLFLSPTLGHSSWRECRCPVLSSVSQAVLSYSVLGGRGWTSLLGPYGTHQSIMLSSWKITSSKPGFLHLSTTDTVDQMSLCCGGCFAHVRYLAASLTVTLWMPGPSSFPAVTTQKRSRDIAQYPLASKVNPG